ncbi:GlsB/YeaQ/YmgE family stress response membrane protein [Corynebacterium uterequi]|uniref:Putative membrane protein n=1 Tax=Corynebacterium uterequi TaxID=1072256 RepID=A0A0G3HFN2_9CORY|nr:GlsB/YeaQ/YmgE family stress response membrane protein [Corynebacterium uterequi]AKK12116.1 putative membrane protein [Corynebacterium uterequi]
MGISLGGFFGWLILGGLAGWIASKIKGRDAQMGIVANILVGVVGAILGGALLGLFFDVSSFGLFASFLTAILGACILLGLLNMIRK